MCLIFGSLFLDRLGQRAGQDLDGVADLAGDDRLAFAGEDLPSWSWDRQFTLVVGLSLLYVLFAAEHLQVPQSEEDDSEHDERDAAENRDAQSERRSRGPAHPAARVAWPQLLDRAHRVPLPPCRNKLRPPHGSSARNRSIVLTASLPCHARAD